MPGKERPITFSAFFIRSLLSGDITQARRVMNPQPWDLSADVGGILRDMKTGKPLRCPFGVPGQKLWVREAWAPHGDTVAYLGDSPDSLPPWHPTNQFRRWRPSIHMPRWASRITLEVTDVRVQRVRDISEEDAEAGGVEEQFRTLIPIEGKSVGRTKAYSMAVSYRAGYANEWDSINAKKGHGWSANPWLWALTFRVAEWAAGDLDELADRSLHVAD